MTDTYNSTQNNRNLVPGGADDGPLEKDFSTRRNGRGHEHLDGDMEADDALKRIRTTGSLSISPELFEKLYLSPQNRVSGDLRKTFANPTPLAIVGFLISLTPLSCDLMGWRGAGGGVGNGAASTAVYLFFGGLLMILGSVGEWIIGNTFPFVVFGSFGAFWLSFSCTLQPFYNAWGAYSTTTSPAEGLTEPAYNASFAFFLLWMGVLCFVYMICALRTNVVFVLIFAFLVPAFGCLAGAYWYLAQGNTAVALKLITAGGATSFVVDVCGWYLLAAILLASVDFPFILPVGDLSHLIRGASDRAKDRGDYAA